MNGTTVAAVVKQYHIIENVIVVALAIAIWFAVKAIFKATRRRYGDHYEELDRRSAASLSAVRAIIRTIYLIALAVILLEVNGVSVAGLMTSLGVGTAVAGFAFQDYLKDLICGMRIAIGHFFIEGDVIRFKGDDCQVHKFNLRTTVMQSIADGTVYIVGNRELDVVERPSHMVDLDLPLPYEEDVRKIHRTLTQTAEKLTDIEGLESAEYKGTQSFADSAIIYKLRFYCDPLVKPNVWRAVMKVVQEDLLTAGIDIPYNQITVSYLKEQAHAERP